MAQAPVLHTDPVTLFREQARLTSGPLAGRVASAISYRSSGNERSVHRGMPSPWLTFIVSFDEPVRLFDSDVLSTDTGFLSTDTGFLSTDTGFESTSTGVEPTTTGFEVILAGLHRRATLIDSPPAEAGLQLAIEPTACRALFGVPAAELVNSTLEADAVVGNGASSLTRIRERMHQDRAKPPSELLRQWLLGRSPSGTTARSDAARPEVVEAWRLITGSRGRMQIQEVARQVWLSPRQLRTLFTAEYGLGPKAVAGVARLNNATSQLARSVQHHQRVDLAALAQATGYADQSHLAREFADAIGQTATGWLTQERRNLQAGGHAHGAE